MKTCVYYKSANIPPGEQALKCMLQGIPNSFINDTLVPSKSDLAVLYGSWKPRKAPHHVIKNKVIATGVDFICIATPIIGRNPTDASFDGKWWRVGKNHFLNTLGDFNNKNKPSDRWNKIQKSMNLEVKPWRTSGSHIVVSMQIPGDAALLGTSIYDWAMNSVKQIQSVSDRKIHVKRHPAGKDRDARLGADFYKTVSKINNVEITEDKNILQDAWAAVCYTSGYAVDCVLQGVPVVAEHYGSFAYEFGNKIKDIETIELLDRQQWLNNLAYAQWHTDEMKSGEYWKHYNS
jgi:hypothetical protein